jgi:phosphoadenosine phosphosulfate reductase
MRVTLEGKTMVDIAIERIQANEPLEGYHLAFSGGKDSVVLYDLAVRAGVRFDAHCNQVGIEPPEVIRFMQSVYPDVTIEHPPKTFWKLFETNGLPTRRFRWCCKLIKEVGGIDRTVLTGIRYEESTGRKSRLSIEDSYRHKGKKYVHPIFEWASSEIWDYIHANKVPYCSLYDEKYHRIGCVLCPQNTRFGMFNQAFRWPKIEVAWHRAAIRFWDNKHESRVGLQSWQSGEEYWQWWLSKGAVQDERQASFEMV